MQGRLGSSLTPQPQTTVPDQRAHAVAFCRQLKSLSSGLSDVVYDGDPVVMEFTGQAGH